jgi:hypothetical protein
MNKKIKSYLWLGVVVVSVLGTLSHFAYEWLGRNPVVALFCPVNESTWEHIKLLFFPMLLYTLCLSAKERNREVQYALLSGNLIGTLLIPVLFYTYTGILGYNITAVDVAIFFVSVLAAFFAAYRMLRRGKKRCCQSVVVGMTVLLCVLFFVFTFYPPDIALFVSPEVQS